jgi:acetyl esterase/lipase
MPYARDQMDAIAADLAARGFAVWNLEYCRIGAPEHEWQAATTDVAAGIDHLAQLVADGVDLDLERIAVVGHSAGGHLALWAAGRSASSTPGAMRLRARVAVGQAPVADLALAHRLDLGRGAVGELLGGSPAEVPERYRQASPIEMLPLRVRHLILHGTADDAIPVELSRQYARAAAAAGDTVELAELAGAGHMEYLDPASEAHCTLVRWLTSTLDVPAPSVP